MDIKPCIIITDIGPRIAARLVESLHEKGFNCRIEQSPQQRYGTHYTDLFIDTEYPQYHFVVSSFTERRARSYWHHVISYKKARKEILNVLES